LKVDLKAMSIDTVTLSDGHNANNARRPAVTCGGQITGLGINIAPERDDMRASGAWPMPVSRVSPAGP
jgi:hypothetical protein